MPELTWIPVSFEGGLDESFDATWGAAVADGHAAVFQNYDWLPGGGILPRAAWLQAGNSPTGAPATKVGRGIFTRWYESGNRLFVQAFYDNSSTFTMAKTSDDAIASFASYTAFDSSVAVTSGYRKFPVKFAVGNNRLVYVQPGFPSGRIRHYDGATVTALATDAIAGNSLDNIGGRALAYHLSRFWTGGGQSNPTWLRYSEIGRHDAWNTSENYIPVSQDDGEPINELLVWDGNLMVGKDHSLWYVAGKTTDTFLLRQVPTDEGPARGNTMMLSPRGIFFVAPSGHVYLFDGSAVERVTKKVRIPAQGANDYMSLAYVGGKVFVKNSSDDDTYVYELGSDRWRVEKFSNASNQPLDLWMLDGRFLLASPANGTVPLLFRSETDQWGTSASSTRQPFTDESTATAYIARTQEWWPADSFGKATLRSIYLRYRQWGTATARLTVTPVVDGTEITAQAKQVGAGAMGTGKSVATRLDFNADPSLSGRNIAIKFSSSPTAGQDTYAVEQAVLGVLVDSGRR